jgi:thiol:disulfide interchange protein DsbC
MRLLWSSVLPAALLMGLATTAFAGQTSLERALDEFIPGTHPDQISRSPVPGLYEVRYGPKLFYVSEDGRFLIEGSIYDLRKKRDVTASRLAKATIAAIDSLGEDSMIVYTPLETKYTVTVFSDPGCPPCRLFHSKINEYLAEGIRVRYLLYPIGGSDTESYKRAVSVWCAQDRKSAFARAEFNAPTTPWGCKNPVNKNVMLGRMIGIAGAPTIVTSDGKIIPGYVSPEQLLTMLDAGSP